MRQRQHREIVIQAWRGATVESVHRAVAAVAGPDGEVVERWGDPRFVTFWRSSAKPFQAQAWLADGTVEHFGWGAEELAIMSASHDGTDEHAALIRRMLADTGLDETALRAGGDLGVRHSCSGNHLGFLAASAHHGWDLATYQRPRHPAQIAALRSFAAAVGAGPADLATAVDGCGVVTYATAVETMASAWALMPSLLPEISAAMRAHPVLVEGEGRLDTLVMQTFDGLTGKCGAEGVSCVSLPDGRGLAVKVLDGADRAVAPVAVGLVAQLLSLEVVPEPVAKLTHPPITNDAGDVVGELLAVFPD
ncbi:MAG: asparaginase [Thermoleophilia bacterium]|nr:asparaginase [Thermoleophilia bacterium]